MLSQEREVLGPPSGSKIVSDPSHRWFIVDTHELDIFQLRNEKKNLHQDNTLVSNEVRLELEKKHEIDSNNITDDRHINPQP